VHTQELEDPVEGTPGTLVGSTPGGLHVVPRVTCWCNGRHFCDIVKMSQLDAGKKDEWKRAAIVIVYMRQTYVVCGKVTGNHQVPRLGSPTFVSV
jgi:hypothetical protein